MDEYGEPPDIDAPRGGSWLGEWSFSFAWDTSMPRDAKGKPVWFREYLEHDGHEECCHHTDFVAIDVAYYVW